MKVVPAPMIDRHTLDKVVIDTVLKALYNNADKDILHIEHDIYASQGLKLPLKESERLWDVMIASGWVSPVIGFGNAGKLELTREGYQLMAQYGGYHEYLAAVSAANSQQPTLILPIQVEESQDPQITPQDNKQTKTKKKK
ncbi:hypothetical protein CAP35_09960 [Chitinophagaceae bacterium IBVUCB1]|nr:hypothetical protein CAP35_09960 [Chitinophagaceae bacterium IBVUCB1]